MSHVEIINSNWPHRYQGSDEFVLYSIKYHLNIGLFADDGDLLGWCLRYDNGSLGLLHVADAHLRKGYGTVIAKAFSKLIAEKSNYDVTAQIVHENFKSRSMFEKIGFKPADGHTWFVVKNKIK